MNSSHFPLLEPGRSDTSIPFFKHPTATYAFFLLTRPARPPPKGEVNAKSTCFWLSTRTMKEGTSTTCLPTLSPQRAGAAGRSGGW